MCYYLKNNKIFIYLLFFVVQGAFASKSDDVEVKINKDVELKVLEFKRKNRINKILHKIEYRNPQVFKQINKCSDINVSTNHNGMPVGNLRYTLTCINLNSVSYININIKVFLYFNIYVASRNLNKGTILSGSNVKLAKYSFFKNKDFVVKLSSIKGMIVKRKLKTGEPVTLKKLTPIYTIHKGDSIKIYYSTENIIVSVAAVALENGQKGEYIKFKNNSSGKTVTAMVINKYKALMLLDE